jgi:O-antigen ligase
MPESTSFAAGYGFESLDDNRSGQVFDRGVVVGMCLLLAFAILAFGAAEYWAMCLVQVGASGLFALWTAGQIARRQKDIHYSSLFVPVVLLSLLIAFQLLWPKTDYWYATWVKALQWVSYALLFFVSTQVMTGSKRLRNVGLFFVMFGFLVAVIAIAQGGTTADKVYWLFESDATAQLYGPYPNHAHYAGLMEMLFPVALVFALSQEFRPHARLLLYFAAIVMAGSIFLAASLGGILSFLGELVVLGIVVLRGRRGAQIWRSVLIVLLLLSFFAVMLQPTALQERLQHWKSKSERVEVTERLDIVRDSMAMVAKRPVLGYGLGTFIEVFPRYRTFYTDYIVNAAHNEYVQVLVELGVTGLILILVLVVLLFRDGMKKAMGWQHDCERAMALAALVGCSGILIHSLCDFNLQVPANAALFSVFAGLAVSRAQPVPVFKRKQRGIQSRQWERLRGAIGQSQ